MAEIAQNYFQPPTPIIQPSGLSALRKYLVELSEEFSKGSENTAIFIRARKKYKADLEFTLKAIGLLDAFQSNESQPSEAGEGNKEFILCAANFYQDGEVRVHNPKNIETGFITCGRRHHNCISAFAMIVGFPYNEASQAIQNTEVQGFLTNTNRFVDRKEAFQIARLANQIKGPNKGQQENSIGLTSEDLY
jgi:hypothetical protein